MFIQAFRSICKCAQLPKFTLFWDFLTTMIHSFKAPWVGNCYWPDISIKSSFPEITSSTQGWIWVLWEGVVKNKKKGSPMCPMFGNWYPLLTCPVLRSRYLWDLDWKRKLLFSPYLVHLHTCAYARTAALLAAGLFRKNLENPSKTRVSN